jgi:hypothetical protein
VLCIVFFGVFQVSQLYTAREIVDYAAARGARARAVGLNSFMVFKVVRVGTIPNAGLMTAPGYQRSTRPSSSWDVALTAHPSSPQYEVERSRIPLYLGAETYGRLKPILDYEQWNSNTISHVCASIPPVPMAQVRVTHDYPLRLPFHRTFYDSDEVALEGTAEFGGHYALYLEQ